VRDGHKKSSHLAKITLETETKANFRGTTLLVAILLFVP